MFCFMCFFLPDVQTLRQYPPLQTKEHSRNKEVWSDCLCSGKICSYFSAKNPSFGYLLDQFGFLLKNKAKKNIIAKYYKHDSTIQICCSSAMSTQHVILHYSYLMPVDCNGGSQSSPPPPQIKKNKTINNNNNNNNNKQQTKRNDKSLTNYIT